VTTTFQRAALMDAVKSAISNMKAELDKYDADVAAFKERHRKRWLAESLPQLKRRRDRLTKLLAKGGTVTSSDLGGDINRLLYTPPSSYDIGKTVGYIDRSYRKDFAAKINAYTGVLALLEAQTGDTISIAQLKTLGINKTAELFRLATNAGGTFDKNPLI
jgi:hypothetical protein